MATFDVIGLVSGGKDSFFSLVECERAGHRVVALANLAPPPAVEDEADSWMYQSVGWQVVDAYAHCMGIPLYRARLTRTSQDRNLAYLPDDADEVEDLFELLRVVLSNHPTARAVSSGAILSHYQRLRVECVCARLNLVSLAFMWERNQHELLQAMLAAGVDAVLVKVAAIGLKSRHLGKSLAVLAPLLERLAEQYDCNECGEGGEFETLVLDCPLFRRYAVVLTQTRTVLHADDAFAPVSLLSIREFRLRDKEHPDADLVDIATLDSSAVRWIDVSASTNTSSVASNLKQEAGSAAPRNDPEAVRNSSGLCIFACHEASSETDATYCMRQVCSQLKSTLDKGEPLPSSLSERMLYMSLYVSHMSLFGKLNEEYREAFGLHCPPSRACVELPCVPFYGTSAAPATRVTACGLAVHPRKRAGVLHVQSISKWAPACIGPYSQATSLPHAVLLAGQIGLHPDTMTLLHEGHTGVSAHLARGLQAFDSARDRSFVLQLRQALQSNANVLKCQGGTLSAVVSATLFLVDPQQYTLAARVWEQELAFWRDASPAAEEKMNDSDEEVEMFRKIKLHRTNDTQADSCNWPRPDLHLFCVSALPRGALVELQLIGGRPGPDTQAVIKTSDLFSESSSIPGLPRGLQLAWHVYSTVVVATDEDDAPPAKSVVHSAIAVVVSGEKDTASLTAEEYRQAISCMVQRLHVLVRHTGEQCSAPPPMSAAAKSDVGGTPAQGPGAGAPHSNGCNPNRLCLLSLNLWQSHTLPLPRCVRCALHTTGPCEKSRQDAGEGSIPEKDLSGCTCASGQSGSGSQAWEDAQHCRCDECLGPLALLPPAMPALPFLAPADSPVRLELLAFLATPSEL